MDFLTRVPPEILLEIGDHLYDDLPALGSLAVCNRPLNEVFEPVLYKANIQQCVRDSETRQSIPRSLAFAAWNDLTGTLNKTTIAMACFSGGTAVTIDHMGDIPPALGLQGKGTALHVASYRGSNNVVRALLAIGADVNVLSSGICDHACRRAWRPLHFALCQGHSSTAKILIRAGARYAMSDDRPDNNGTGVIGAIHSACCHSAHDKPLFELLYRTARKGQGDWGEDHHGPMADFFNRPTRYGSPIHFAILTSHRQGTKQLSNLIKWGADINKKPVPVRLRAPLRLAIVQGMWAAARVLLSQGASLRYSVNDPPDLASYILFRLLVGINPGSDWSCFEENRSADYYYRTCTPLDKDEIVIWRTERWGFIKTLIAHYRIDINNVFTRNGESPLTALAKYGAEWSAFDHRLELIPFMVTQLGADPARADRNGHTVLYRLARGFYLGYGTFPENNYNAIASTTSWVIERIGWAWMEVDNYVGDKNGDISPLRVILMERRFEPGLTWNYRHRLWVIDLFLGYKRFRDLQPIAFQDFVEARTKFSKRLQEASTTPQENWVPPVWLRVPNQ